MESIGQLLKSTRESKGYSLELAGRETNISRHYLVSLEEEKYGDFPAEAYVFGFLRTYSEFLGLNGEDLVNRYRTLQIQEQPAPMNILLKAHNPWPFRVLLGTLGLAVVIGLGIAVIPPVVGWFSSIEWSSADSSQSSNRTPVVHNLEEASKDSSYRLFRGDSVKVTLGDQVHDFSVDALNESILLTSALGETRLKLGAEAFLDLDNNTSQDLRVFLQDITPSDPTKGAQVAFERVIKPKDLSEGQARVPLGEEKLVPGSLVVNPGEAGRPERQRSSVTVLESPQAGPINLEVVFRGYSFFRYVVDNKVREEGYFEKGDRRVITAENRLILWVSNSGSFTGRIQGKELELGRPGEVSSKVLEWVKNNQTGLMELRANPVY